MLKILMSFSYRLIVFNGCQSSNSYPEGIAPNKYSKEDSTLPAQVIEEWKFPPNSTYQLIMGYVQSPNCLQVKPSPYPTRKNIRETKGVSTNPPYICIAVKPACPACPCQQMQRRLSFCVSKTSVCWN